MLEHSRSVNLYGRLAENVGKFLPTDQLNNFALETSDTTEILKSGIDGETFYKFEQAVLSSYLPWLTGNTDSLEFSYNLQEIKQKLTAMTNAKIIAKYNSSPTCTSAEIRDWGFDEGLPSCQLPSGILGQKSIANLSNQAATKITDDIPDTLTASQGSLQLRTTRTKIALVFKTIQIIWMVTIFLVAVYLILWRTSGLISLSICFLLVGLLQITFSLIGWDWITKTIGDILGGVMGEAKAIAPVLIDLLAVILEAMKTVMGNISIGFLTTGSVLIIVSFIGKVYQPKTERRI